MQLKCCFIMQLLFNYLDIYEWILSDWCHCVAILWFHWFMTWLLMAVSLTQYSLMSRLMPNWTVVWHPWIHLSLLATVNPIDVPKWYSMASLQFLCWLARSCKLTWMLMLVFKHQTLLWSSTISIAHCLTITSA